MRIQWWIKEPPVALTDFISAVISSSQLNQKLLWCDSNQHLSGVSDKGALRERHANPPDQKAVHAAFIVTYS